MSQPTINFVLRHDVQAESPCRCSTSTIVLVGVELSKTAIYSFTKVIIAFHAQPWSMIWLLMAYCRLWQVLADHGLDRQAPEPDPSAGW